MTITYINHSGFLLETSEAYFLFDYYKGELPTLDVKKPLVVFASHRHPDHFNSAIFDIITEHPDTMYVLDKDTPFRWRAKRYQEQGINLENKIIAVRKNTEQEISLSNQKKLEIKTLKSTDTGVAFLIQFEGKNYYHAGDLNLWIWEGETKQYNDNMRKAYYAEMEKLKGLEIDVAFVPLDPRLEGHAFEGMKIFLEYTDTKMAFPMHFWGEYDLIEKFINKHPEYQGKVAMIERDGQVFRIKSEGLEVMN